MHCERTFGRLPPSRIVFFLTNVTKYPTSVGCLAHIQAAIPIGLLHSLAFMLQPPSGTYVAFVICAFSESELRRRAHGAMQVT